MCQEDNEVVDTCVVVIPTGTATRVAPITDDTSRSTVRTDVTSRMICVVDGRQ